MLFPSYFALVMATGALSISSFLLGMPVIANLLFYFNVVFYITLWLLPLMRLMHYFPLLADDAMSHQRGPGFFTLVAGTSVFGSQLIVVAGNHSIAFYLWMAAGL